MSYRRASRSVAKAHSDVSYAGDVQGECRRFLRRKYNRAARRLSKALVHEQQ